MEQVTSHPQAGKLVQVKSGQHAGKEYRVEDYWRNVAGKSWKFCDGNPVCLMYAMRSAMSGLPLDDDVVYGKIDGHGHILHVSELGEVTE